MSLGHSFGRRPALGSIDLDVAPGERLALLGPNGAGKTTLLRVLATLERLQRGDAWILGRHVARERAECRRGIGLVAHQPLLYGDLTAAENLRFFARLHGLDRTAVPEAALARAGLTAAAGQRARTLSHGQLQRLALARAMLHEPAVLLADEPHTGLDLRAAAALDTALADLAGRGCAVILSTHDVERATRVADRIGVLSAGRLTWLGPAAAFPGWDATVLATGDPRPAPRGAPTLAVARHVTPPSLGGVVATLVAKELALELRTRQAVPLAAVFALLVAVVYRFAVPASIGDLGPAATGAIHFAGSLWISLAFGTTLALGRAATADTESGAATAVVLSPADPGGVFLGKWLGAFATGCAVAAVLVPAEVVFLNVSDVPLAPLAALTALGLAGWAAAATLVTAMLGAARSREALAPIILLPVAAPLLVALVDATGAALAGAGWAALAAPVTVVASFAVIFAVAGFLTYGHLAEASA